MAERSGIHADVAGYVLDALAPAEAGAFEAHLPACPECAGEIAALRALPELLAAAAPPFEVPAGLEARVLAAMEPAAPRRRRFRWAFVPVAATAALVVLLVVVLAGGDDALERYELQGGGAQVSATVQTTGVGREVTVDIDRLVDPRPDGLYELWFVAADDRPGRPHRVSAGTFHPDDEGRGRVRLVGAADPKLYPRITVTLEPADGNPRLQGPTVLRAVPGR